MPRPLRSRLEGGQAVTYDHWKATEPDPYAHEPVGECHWCRHRAVLYRTWLCYPVEAWVCGDCLDERSSPLPRSTAAGRLGSEWTACRRGCHHNPGQGSATIYHPVISTARARMGSGRQLLYRRNCASPLIDLIDATGNESAHRVGGEAPAFFPVHAHFNLLSLVWRRAHASAPLRDRTARRPWAVIR